MSKPADFLKWKMIQAAGILPSEVTYLLEAGEVEIFLGMHRHYYLYGGPNGAAVENARSTLRSWTQSNLGNWSAESKTALMTAEKRWEQYKCLQKQTS